MNLSHINISRNVSTELEVLGINQLNFNLFFGYLTLL